MTTNVVLKRGVGGRVAIESDRRFAVADARTFTLYEDGRSSAASIAPEPLPGPVVALSEGASRSRGGLFGWGPTAVSKSDYPLSAGKLVRAGLSDVMDRADREYRIVVGAVDATGQTAVVFLRWQPPRSIGGAPKPRGPYTRLATVDLKRLALGDVIAYNESSDPTAIAWGAGAIAVGASGKVLVWPSPSNAPIQLPTSSPKSVRELATTSNGDLLAAGMTDGNVLVWKTGKSWPGLAWPAHQNPVTAVNWGLGGQTLWTGSADGTVRQWRADGQRLTEFAVSGEVTGVGALDANQVVVATGGSRASTLLVSIQ